MTLPTNLPAMKIEHVAIWVQELERCRDFYTRFFGAVAGEKYHNPKKEFQSYFLSFSDGARLEIMQQPGIPARPDAPEKEWKGITHLAFSTGSREEVDALTEKLRQAGFPILGEPRTTGDGYYESVVADPEGNRIEITA